MENISKQVGKNIRTYRQAKKLTLDAFSAQIHKSKSTLSKYEKGEIALDLDTFYQIAVALGVTPEQLLYVPVNMGQSRGEEIEVFSDEEYFYSYDGIANRLTKGILRTTKKKDCTEQSATFFYNIPDFNQKEKCRSLYYGTMHQQDFITNFSFQNQTNTVERTFLCLLNPLEYKARRFGLFTGISSRTLMPVSIKCILSPHPIKEDEELTGSLLLSKEDLRLTKRLNMFVIDQLV